MRHAFHAMGTEVRLHLDATPAADALLVEAEGEFHRLEALLSSTAADLRAHPPRRGRRARSRPGPARGRRRGPRGARADREAVRPDRPRRARGDRVWCSFELVPVGGGAPVLVGKACGGGVEIDRETSRIASIPE